MAPTAGSKDPKAKNVARPKQTNNAGVHKRPKPRHRPGHVHVPPLISKSAPESSTVSEASLPNLPPELKIQIFGFVNSFSAVKALSSTSRTFNSIWKLNANHICDAILKRVIKSPVEAKALIDAQKFTRQTQDDQNLKLDQKDRDGYQQAARRLQQYLTNKVMASRALKYFEECETRRKLSSRERAHFVQAYYRARVLVLLSTDGIPESLITTWNMLDSKRVHEILDCIYMGLQLSSPRQRALVSEEESKSVLGRYNPVSKWEVALHRMNLLEAEILAILPEIYSSGPHEVRLGFFITYDVDATTKNNLRKVPMAGVLSRLPEWSLDQDVDFDEGLGELGL